MLSGVWAISVVCSFGAMPATEAENVPPRAAVMPIEVRDGRTSLSLEGGQNGKSYLMVMGSLVPRGKPSPVYLDRDSESLSSASRPIPILSPVERPAWWTWRVENDRRQMDRVRQTSDSAPPYSAARFPLSRTFHLFVGEDDLYDAKKYVPVTATLARAGKWCLVYTDAQDKVSAEFLDEVVRTFDERVYPAARQRFGQHRDVDRNGKFTILVTGWLERLSGGKVALSGFVRGADFYRDVSPPFSNQCDMLYLNASLTSGEHLRTVLAHEYTHAITFSEHTFTEYLPGAHGQDEEAWLSEAIAHLAENLHGDGWSNLDYRVSTYLSETGSYRLVVPDYFQDGLWRSHGCRGATYLFLRYLVDRFGPDLLTELSRSNLEGIANIETATQTPFSELFRDWSISLAAGGAWGHSVVEHPSAVPLFGRLGERLLAGPRPTVMTERSLKTSLSPTSWTSVIVRVDAGQKESLRIQADSSADLQVTLMEIPADRVASQVRIVSDGLGSSRVRMDLQSSRPVRWQSISWERAKLRQERARANEKLARIVAAPEVLEIDERHPLRAISDPIDLTEFEGDSVVFKMIGLDETGRYVSAWATYIPSELINASAKATTRREPTR
jgi:hypothetical protein